MRLLSVATIAAVALFASFHGAAAADPRVVLRAGAGWIGATGEWTGDLLITEGVSITELSANSTIGPQLSLEYRFTHLVGGEVTVLQASQEIAGTTVLTIFGEPVPHDAVFGQVTEWPILLGVNFHVTKGKPIDLYLGPVIGWVIWDDLEPSAEAEQEVAIGPIGMQDDFAWGLNVGADVPFTVHWAFNFDLRALDYSATTNSDSIKAVLGEDLKIPISPLVVTVGFAVRW